MFTSRGTESLVEQDLNWGLSANPWGVTVHTKSFSKKINKWSPISFSAEHMGSLSSLWVCTRCPVDTSRGRSLSLKSEQSGIYSAAPRLWEEGISAGGSAWNFCGNVLWSLWALWVWSTGKLWLFFKGDGSEVKNTKRTRIVVTVQYSWGIFNGLLNSWLKWFIKQCHNVQGFAG